MKQPSFGAGVVSGETLVYQQAAQEIIVSIGSPAWYAWLEQVHSFSFRSEDGTFTAHKTRASNRRGGWYWYAYCHRQGHFFRSYLGTSSKLTLERLRETTRQFFLKTEAPVPDSPAFSFPSPELMASLPERRQLPFFSAKCLLPRLPVQHVPRERLVALLEKGTAGPLTLVSAPAGSGKTTLLTEWAHATKLSVTWLSLETADSDPARFLMYLLATLRTLDAQIGREASTLLETSPASDLESVLSQLSSDLTLSLTTDAVLVLDDYHVLENETTHQLLLFLLEHLPQRLHLVLGTRVDPPLPLARLRARGHLCEIRADTLRFAPIEVKTFLHGMELELAEDALNTLEQRTEGWVAGVQLAALALRGRSDHETFLREFRGTHRFLLEYIGEEILACLTPQVRAFLLQTSILEQMSGSLCDSVTASIGGQAMLEELRKANLFVSALDENGEWYRYHALFAEGLRHQLLQQEPERFSELCARASAWYEAHEMLFEACEYALQARDYGRAVPLIERQVGKLIGRMQFPLLQRWLEQLPPEIITSRPLLGVASTWALLIEDDQSEPLAQMVAQLQQRFQEHTAATDEEGWVEARANLNFMRLLQTMGNNDAEGALEVARQTLQALPEDATSLRRLASVCLGLAQGIAHRVNGDYAAAERVLIEAGMQTRTTTYHFLNLAATSVLVGIYEGQGELHKLEGLYQGLIRMVHAHREAPPELVLWIYLGYAKLLLDWNCLDEAEDAIHLALAAQQRTQINDLTLACRFVQLWISQARGGDEETRELLQKMEKELSGIPLIQTAVRFDALWRVRLLLSRGKGDEAWRWLRASGLSYDDPFTTLPDNDFFFARYMTLARVLIVQGRRSPKTVHLQQAQVLLERFCPFYEKAGFKGRVAEILVLKSLALQARGETLHALITLGRAVSLAEPTGVVRLFADEGEVMTCLLAQVSVYTTASSTYLHTLQTANASTQHAVLEAVQATPRQLLIDPLSPREREVLLLLAAGFSNQQIADRLVISLNTAKRHVKHILAKLAAANRTQAVTRARDLHLL